MYPYYIHLCVNPVWFCITLNLHLHLQHFQSKIFKIIYSAPSWYPTIELYYIANMSLLKGFSNTINRKVRKSLEEHTNLTRPPENVCENNVKGCIFTNAFDFIKFQI